MWKSKSTYANLTEYSKAKNQQYLDKLYIYGITTITQIQNNNTMAILTPEELWAIYKQTPKIIMEALLQQAKVLIPTQPHAFHMNHHQQSQQTLTNITHITTSSIQPTPMQATRTIIKEKTTSNKDK